MPSGSSSAALPTPETCSSWGELIAPPQRMTVAGADLRGGPAAVLVLHADSPLALEEDPGHERAGHDLEVGAVHHGVEVGPRRRQPPAVPDVAVEGGEALLPVAVDVIGAGVAGLLAGAEERLEERVRGRTALEREGAVVPTERVAGIGREAVLHPVEVGQAVRVVPGLHARVGRPALVVQRVPALEDHPVDAARTAEHLAAGVVDPAAVHLRLGLRLVLPVVEAAADREGEGGRHVDEDVPGGVVATRFQDEHGAGRVGRQTVGQGGTGGAASDDHVVVAGGSHRLPPFCRGALRRSTGTSLWYRLYRITH